MINCACGYRVDYPIRLLIKRHGADTVLHLIGMRLLRERCKQRLLSVQMVDRPARTN